MNLGNRKNLMIAGGAAAVIIIAAVVVFMMTRKGPDTTSSSGSFGPGAGQTTQTAGAPPAPGATTRGAAGATQTAAVTPGAPGAVGGAAGTTAPAATEAPKLGVIRLASGESSVTNRPDPMLTFDVPPPPIQPEQKVILPPINLQQGGIRPAGTTVGVSETVANRRVAGLKFGEGAWAILEKDGQTFVVKPGDTVEGTKILAISKDSVLVRDANGQRWQVPMRGATSTTVTQQTAARTPGRGAGPAMN